MVAACPEGEKPCGPIENSSANANHSHGYPKGNVSGIQELNWNRPIHERSTRISGSQHFQETDRGGSSPFEKDP